MRTVTSLFAIGAVVVAAACSSPREVVRATDSRDFPAAQGKLVKIDLTSLDVKVRVAEGPQIHVELELSARASSTAAARRWIERHTPQFDDSEDILSVTQASPRGLFLSAFLHTGGALDVSVPPGCRVEITTSSGDVVIDGPETLHDPLRVRTASGDLTFSGGATDLVYRTASGDLRVDGAPLHLLDVESTSGDVRLRAGAAKVVVDTASGDLRLDDLTGDLSVETTSGDVRAIWASLAPDATVTAATSSGDVSLFLPSGIAPAGELHTSSGSIRSQLDGQWSHNHRRLELTGTTPKLNVKTSSGDIVIRANR